MLRLPKILLLPLLLAVAAQPLARAAEAPPAPAFDLLIRNGLVYDGSGAAPRRVDIAIRHSRVVALGKLAGAEAARVVDAKGLAVAPGFINMLSWAPDALMVDGRGMSDTKQGVTLEIFGEGWSEGPLTEQMKAEALSNQGDIKFDITWTTLGEYLDQLVGRGITPNVASMVGASTVRMHELGSANRDPTAQELLRMQELVRAAMREGALGVGSALIYAPGSYARTPELIALTRAAAESGGGYISHMRSEGNEFEAALDELIRIGRETGVHAEAYHLKAAGQSNWPKMRLAIDKINAARKAGLSISANMYVYVAGATGLDAAMPTWVQEGGLDAWIARLQDPSTREKVIAEMRGEPQGWENLARLAGSTQRILFNGFKSEKLKPLTGKTLAEVMKLRGTSAEDTIIDLVIEDHSRVDTVYFLMSEDNVKMGLRQAWVAIGSDAESSAPEGVFLKSSTHPRAYGNVARLLGKYVRDEKVLSLSEAVRRLTRLPAENWKLKDRGCLDPGCYADLVLFDPARISDHASFERPQQFATGVRDVFVNGVQVLKDGEHTGAKPGQVVHGPGWCGWNKGGCDERPLRADFE